MGTIYHGYGFAPLQWLKLAEENVAFTSMSKSFLSQLCSPHTDYGLGRLKKKNQKLMLNTFMNM